MTRDNGEGIESPDDLERIKKGNDKFPITGKRYFDIHLINSCHVETCCLLSRKYLFAKDHKENDKNN